jgi:hypothetical protein
MSRTLSPEDIKAIGKEFESIIQKCLQRLNVMETTLPKDV